MTGASRQPDHRCTRALMPGEIEASDISFGKSVEVVVTRRISLAVVAEHIAVGLFQRHL